MAETGVSGNDSTLFPHAKALHLKHNLRGLVNITLDVDDFPLARLDEAITTLSAFKDLKCKSAGVSCPQKFDDLSIPPEFRCPISLELMCDPVILATGQTYDRPFIQRWLNEGHGTCPQTQQVPSHSFLTPNHLVHDMISHWCKENGVELPKPVRDIDEEVITGADRSHLNSLLKKLSISISDQKAAAKELRLLTKRMPSFRILFNESCDGILQLLNPLSPSTAYIPPDLHEDLITTVLNLSIHDDNKKIFAEILWSSLCWLNR